MEMNHCIGIAKTTFNTSACLIDANADGITGVSVFLSERITRKKANNAWPKCALQKLRDKITSDRVLIAENRDVTDSLKYEEILDGGFPFFESLINSGMQNFSRKFNPEIKTLSHHLAHAYGAMALSPFEKSIILVMDGAGSRLKDVVRAEQGLFKNADENVCESLSVYLQEGVNLKCVAKEWQMFHKSKKWPKHYFSEGLGTLYEKSAEYIFNSKRASGKVMGLAAHGVPTQIDSRTKFCEELNWDLAFSGKSKTEWESMNSFMHYANIAASVQNHFEETVLTLVANLHHRFPDYKNLILCGGAALNCTTNMKIVNTQMFSEVYVPPFPGDEGISFALASYLKYIILEKKWAPISHEDQHGYFGEEVLISEKNISEIFLNFDILRPPEICEFAAQLLQEGKVLAWFQGRSESGPRALGHRSILARPDKPDLKNYLNTQIKFRESFRPYGCSVLHEKAHLYFDVPEGFNNPYMSFATRTRENFRDIFREVTHFDGTSRMQTVRSGQCPRFHGLLKKFGDKSQIYALLNTSLNVMGEPIVESIEDAKNFLLKVPVDGLVIGDYFIKSPIEKV